MVETKPSEAKLLDIIKAKAKPSSPTREKIRQSIKKWKSSTQWAKISRSLNPRFRLSSQSPLVLAKRILMGFTVFTLTLFLWGFWGHETELLFDESPPKGQRQSGSDSQPQGDQPNSIPIKAIAKRNLFRPLVAPAPRRPKPSVRKASLPPPAPKIPLSRRASHLNLVGVIPGDPPQAVIEDSKKNRSHYVNQGDTIGELRIQAISDGKVTLSYKDETYDLKL